MDLGDRVTTPRAMLDEVRGARRAADDAESLILQLAVEWAHAHPHSDDDGTWRSSTRAADVADFGPDPADPKVDRGTYEWFGLPPVRWDAPAAFAAANNMTTAAGHALIRDALVLRHRLPRLWARVCSGRVTAWRARRIAQSVITSPDDVVAYVDTEVADIAHKVGAVALDRILDDAMLHLYPEQREIEQLEALDRRHVTLHADSINHTGIADLTIRGDWKDLHDFDEAVTEIAAALLRDGAPEPLDVRRSLAVGILADPHFASALLAGTTARHIPRKHAVVYLHLSDLALLGIDPVAGCDTTARAMLEQQVRDWCGRVDTHLTVRPVIDLTLTETIEGYDIPDRMAHRVRMRHRTCVFPWCTRPSRDCDLDHIVPFSRGGPTGDDNLAPLCRRHHRLKTHTAWSYQPDPTHRATRRFIWHDPVGHRYLVDPDGTSEPPAAPAVELVAGQGLETETRSKTSSPPDTSFSRTIPNPRA